MEKWYSSVFKLACGIALVLAVLILHPGSWEQRAGARAKSADPIMGAFFQVEVEGKFAAVFKACSGIGSVSEVIENKTAGKDGKQVIQKIPGRLKWSDVTLSRGLTTDQSLNPWRQEVIDGRMADARKKCTITVLNRAGQPAAVWDLNNAWPSGLIINQEKSRRPADRGDDGHLRIGRPTAVDRRLNQLSIKGCGICSQPLSFPAGLTAADSPPARAKRPRWRPNPPGSAPVLHRGWNAPTVARHDVVRPAADRQPDVSLDEIPGLLMRMRVQGQRAAPLQKKLGHQRPLSVAQGLHPNPRQRRLVPLRTMLLNHMPPLESSLFLIPRSSPLSGVASRCPATPSLPTRAPRPPAGTPFPRWARYIHRFVRPWQPEPRPEVSVE